MREGRRPAVFMALLAAVGPALAVPLLTPEQQLDPTETFSPVNTGVSVDTLRAFNGEIVSSYYDERRQHDLDDIGLTWWHADGGLATPMPISLSAGRWREDGSSFDCLPTGSCLIAYQLGTGPLYGTEVAIFDLNALTAGATVVGYHANQRVPKVVASATRFVVTLTDGVDAWVVSYDAAGVAGTLAKVSSAAGGSGVPSVGTDGTTHLVAWANASDSRVHARLVSATGVPQGGSDFLVSATDPVTREVGVGGAAGQGFCVAWTRAGASRSVSASRVTAAGVVIDPVGLPLDLPATDPAEPSVVFDGSAWLVVWGTTNSTPHVQRRLPLSGPLGVTFPEPVPYDSYRLNVVALPSGLAYGSGNDVRRVGLDGGLFGPKLPVPVVEQSEFKLKAVPGAGGVYFTWELSQPGQSVRSAFVDLTGTVTLLPPAPQGYQGGPAVALLDGAPVVVSAASGRLQAARPQAPGTLLLDVASGGGPDYLGLAAMTTSAGVVFATTRYASGSDVVTTGLPSGAVGAAYPLRQVIAGGGVDRHAVRLAWASELDAGALVYTSTGSTDFVSVLLVDTVGKELEAERRLVTGPGYRIANASVASSGTDFLALVDFHRFGNGPHELMAFQVTPTSGAGDGGHVVMTAPNFSFPGDTALAWDGLGYLAAWTFSAPDGGNLDLYGVRLARDGTLAGQVFPISSGPLSPNHPTVASPRPGEFVIGWTEGAVLPTRFTSARAKFRRWLSLPPRSLCSRTEECEASLCVAGVCTVDSGVVDSGVGDAGSADAGTAGADAGSADAGAVDDAGSLPLGADAGNLGAGAVDEADGGAGTPRALRVGCDCASGGSGLAWMALLAAALRRR